ncbi:hypothetical protein EDB85DRAFT_1898647 [Lactarius pseudohatsudake]|nr:hypothetical protein EDB85DRAFT_1898647 [Lactarius pseudohatsudake]
MTRRQRENEEEDDPYPQPVPRLAKRVNRGQGGAIAQLVSVSEKIRPDLESQSTNQSKRTKTPADASVNAMAPSRLNHSGPLARRDPPLSLATLTPSLTRGRPGSSFGFAPGEFVPPTDEMMDTQGGVSQGDGIGGVSQGDGIGGDLQDDREVPPRRSEDAYEFMVEPIDEQSPDEDARLAEAFLRSTTTRRRIITSPEPEERQSYTNRPVGESTSAGHGRRVSRVLRPEDTDDDGASDEDGGSQSVLQSHQQKNKAIRPPNPDALLATNKRVPSQVPRQTNAGRPLDTPMRVANPRDNRGRHNLAPDNSGRHSLAPNENNAEGSNRNVAPRARSPRTFKPHEEAEPTHLRYYQGTPWYDVLINAKSLYRMEIHTETSGPFPERNRPSLEAAHDSILEAVALLTPAEQASINDTATYHVDHSSMTAVIFDDGASYRGRMKTMARDIVKSHFKAELEPSLAFDHNSSEEAQAISDAVRNCLQNSLFLVGPKLDENGRTENFAHPVAIELCKMFYYSGKDCLSALFPREFSALPVACLIMAFTCIVNCLDEWESGYWVKVPFAGDTYRYRYSLIAGLANDILGNAYHGQRLRARLRKIAADGWTSNTKQRGRDSSGYSFKGWWLAGSGDGGLSGVAVAVTQGRPHGLF